MAVYGYHRVSTKDQHLDRGICEIQEFCKEHDMDLVNIFTDQQTEIGRASCRERV